MVVGISVTSRAARNTTGSDARRNSWRRLRSVTTAIRKISVSAGQQDGERDLVRRLLPLGAFDQRDHAVEEGVAGRGGDAHLDPVGDHGRAAGDRRAVAAGFADHRRGFAGDGGFVDRGDALDHLAVRGIDVAGLDQHDIAGLQRRGSTRSR